METDTVAMEAKSMGTSTTVQCPTQFPSLNQVLSTLIPFQRLRHCLPWWQQHASKFVLDLIQKGVDPNFIDKHLSLQA